MPVFPFVQFEFTHSVGPPAGRYTVRQDEAMNGAIARRAAATESGEGLDDLSASVGTADVVVFQVRGAPPARPKRFRSAATTASVADAEGPAEVSIMAVTAILATSMIPSDMAGGRWMSTIRKSAEAQQELVDRGLARVRECVTAYRCAAADPYVPDLVLGDSRVTRVGYGLGAEVVRGNWSEAVIATPPKAPRITRTGRLMPVQAMADILAGSGSVLDSEGILLGVLRDLDHGRYRAAAVSLAAGVDLLLSELDGRELPGSVANLADQLEATRPRFEEIGQRGVAGQVTTADRAEIRRLAEEAGAVVDAWRYVQLGFG